MHSIDNGIQEVPKGKRRTKFFSVACLTIAATIHADIKNALAETFTQTPAQIQEIAETNDETTCLTDLDREKQTEKIAAINHALSEFSNLILRDLDKYVKNNDMRQKIRRVFETFHENLKSGKIYKISFIHKMDNLASFNGNTRCIRLPADFDPTDIGDLTILIHEISHTEHDDHYRRTANPLLYIGFWSIPHYLDNKYFKAVPQDEADSFARMIEIMNIAMNGNLRRSITTNKKTAIPTKNDSLKKILLEFAQQYYLSPKTFVAYVEEWYKKHENAILYSPELVPIKK